MKEEDYVRLIISDLHLGSLHSKEETLCHQRERVDLIPGLWLRS